MMSMRRELRVAILGAGIMGCSLALLLARRGVRVTLVDRASAPFSGASRWNEGKIHLGFLYAGDPSLATARKLLPGGLAFRPIVEELVGRSIEPAISQEDDIFLTHRDSVADVDATAAYYGAVDDLVREHAEGRASYLTDLSDAGVRKLAPAELSAVTSNEDIATGFAVPERSVRTHLLADWFADAIKAQPSIVTFINCTVNGLAQQDDLWHVAATPPIDETFDIVVNALWEGRAAIDAAVRLADGEIWSYRYRLSLFAKTARACVLPSLLIATGPFGDIKNYNGHDLYLSWYPAGLVIDCNDTAGRGAPLLDATTENSIIQRTVSGLAQYIPGLRDALEGVQITVGGGWVIAPGGGSLADVTSPLHRRDRFGVRRSGSYISVDTGKYSTAPWLAERIADEILGLSSGV
jgi:glycine/D-amino acid oxidase-like deaminating enzyme